MSDVQSSSLLPRAGRFDVIGAARRVSADEAREASERQVRAEMAQLEAEESATETATQTHAQTIKDRNLLRAVGAEAVEAARRVRGETGSWTDSDAETAYLIADLLLIRAGMGAHATARPEMPAGEPSASRRAVSDGKGANAAVEAGIAISAAPRPAGEPPAAEKRKSPGRRLGAGAVRKRGHDQ